MTVRVELNGEERERLEQTFKHTADRRLRERCQAVLILVQDVLISDHVLTASADWLAALEAEKQALRQEIIALEPLV